MSYEKIADYRNKLEALNKVIDKAEDVDTHNRLTEIKADLESEIWHLKRFGCRATSFFMLAG